MLDEYIYGQVERISPEAPVPIVLQKKFSTLPGGAGNVVRNLYDLGAQVYFAGIVGEDAGAEYLRKFFRDLGLSSEQIGLFAIKGRPTTRKTRIFGGHQQICRLDQEVNTPLSFSALEDVRRYIRKNIKDMSALIFSDYDKGLIIPELISEVVELGKKANCLISVDPQITHFEYYRGVDILTPNHHEAGGYLGCKLVDDDSVRVNAPKILDLLDAKTLLLTRGEKGMSLFQKDSQELHHFPTKAREVFDVTGAGDTVISLFTLALTAGASLEEGVELANTGAGLVVAHIGVATVHIDELLSELDKTDP